MTRDYLSECHKGGEMTSLVVSLCTDDINVAKAELRAKYDMLKNHVKKSDEEYSFLIGISNSDVRSNGKKVPFNLHGIVKGNDSFDFTQNVARCINRKAQLKHEKEGIEKRAIPAKTKKIVGLDEDFDDCGMRYVGYILSKCSNKQQYSNASDENKFDFRNFNQS